MDSWQTERSGCKGQNGCGLEWNRSEKFAHCATCHRSFSSDSAFDAHRFGSYVVVGQATQRACFEPDSEKFEIRIGGFGQSGPVYHYRARRPVNSIPVSEPL